MKTYKNALKSSALAKALSISVLNQIVGSGANFLLGMYFVRVLAPTEFGLYGVGIAICMYYSGVGNALFLTQMVVHMPDKSPMERLPYAARTFVMIFLCCLVTLFVSVCISIISSVYFKEFLSYSSFGLSVSLASISYLLKDFFIRLAYSEKREGNALLVNLGFSFILIVLLISVHYFKYILSVENALQIYAISQLAGALIGYIHAKLPINFDINFNSVFFDLKLNWKGGRWALGGVSVTWLQSQAYIYITVLFLGPAEVGAANAARLLISPFMFLIPAFNQVTMPRLVSLRVTDPKKMLQYGKLYTLGMMALALLYIAALYIAFDDIIPLMVGKNYSNLGVLVSMWCAVLLFLLARDGASTLMQALKEFKTLTIVNTVSASIAVIVAVILINLIGTSGAILGTAIGEIILSILLWKRIRRHELC